MIAMAHGMIGARERKIEPLVKMRRTVASPIRWVNGLGLLAVEVPIPYGQFLWRHLRLRISQRVSGVCREK